MAVANTTIKVYRADIKPLCRFYGFTIKSNGKVLITEEMSSQDIVEFLKDKPGCYLAKSTVYKTVRNSRGTYQFKGLWQRPNGIVVAIDREDARFLVNQLYFQVQKFGWERYRKFKTKELKADN